MSNTVYYSGINKIRDEHVVYNPVTGLHQAACLLEQYARNGVTNGDSWVSGGFSTVTNNFSVAPDGTTTMAKIMEDSTPNVWHAAVFNINNMAATTNQAITLVARAGTRNKCFVNFTGGTPFTDAPVFDLVNGAVLQTQAGVTSTITPINGSSGDFLIQGQFMSGASDTRAIVIGPCDNAGSAIYSGDGSSYIQVWRFNHYDNRGAPSSTIFPITDQGGYDPDSNDPLYQTGPVPDYYYGTGRYPDSAFEMDGSGIGLPTLMSGCFQFIEAGSAYTVGAGLFYLGKVDATGARLYLARGTTGYEIVHNNGSSAVRSTAATFPLLGQFVSLRWQFNADGSVQLWQLINSGSEVASAVSAALTPAAAWGDLRIFLNGIGKTNLGYVQALLARVGTGSKTLAQLLALV